MKDIFLSKMTSCRKILLIFEVSNKDESVRSCININTKAKSRSNVHMEEIILMLTLVQ